MYSTSVTRRGLIGIARGTLAHPHRCKFQSLWFQLHSTSTDNNKPDTNRYTYTVQHYINPDNNYIQRYYDLYAKSYNAFNHESGAKRDDNYATETMQLLSRFDTVHAYVAEDKDTKELLAGTMLIEIRTDKDFEYLKDVVGADVHKVLHESLGKYNDWKQLGLYFQKGSFTAISIPVAELYEITFQGPPGIHMYSTIPSIHAKNKIMHPHQPLCSDIILGKKYTYYEFIVPMNKGQDGSRV
jgi:hypothetical protein